MITQLDGFPPHVVAFSAAGRISRDDYEKILMPAVEAGFAANKELDLYYQIADFEGVEFAAAWDDMLVGLRHFTQWNRIAIVTDVAWLAHTISAFGFMMPATIKVFPLAEADKAKAWITS